MSMTTAMDGPSRRRTPIRRILLIAAVCFIVIEPIIMYRSLTHQRAQRQTTRQEAARQDVPAGDRAVPEAAAVPGGDAGR
jgi:hypothetical protein